MGNPRPPPSRSEIGLPCVAGAPTPHLRAHRVSSRFSRAADARTPAKTVSAIWARKPPGERILDLLDDRGRAGDEVRDDRLRVRNAALLARFDPMPAVNAVP